MIIIMSRHAKRLSVFDRLGPGNDEELTPPVSFSFYYDMS